MTKGRMPRIVASLLAAVVLGIILFVMVGLLLRATVWGRRAVTERFTYLGEDRDPGWQASPATGPASGVHCDSRLHQSRDDFLGRGAHDKTQMLAGNSVRNGWNYEFLRWQIGANLSVTPDGDDYRFWIVPAGGTRECSVVIEHDFDRRLRTLTLFVTETFGGGSRSTTLRYVLTPDGFAELPEDGQDLPIRRSDAASDKCPAKG